MWVENLRSQKVYVNVSFKWMDPNTTCKDLKSVCVDGDVDMLVFTRAVLEEIRDPGDLVGNDLPPGYRPGSHSAREIWQSHIDSILKQG